MKMKSAYKMEKKYLFILKWESEEKIKWIDVIPIAL